MLSTKIVLSDFGFGVALDGLKQEWENLRTQRDLVYLQQLNKIHAGE